MDPFEEADRDNAAARQRHERERFERERALRRGPQAPPDDLPLFNPTQRNAQEIDL